MNTKKTPFIFKRLTALLSILILVTSCSSEDKIPAEEQQFTLTFTSGEGGTVSTGGGVYDYDETVTVTALPNEGYQFWKWSDDSLESTLSFVNQNATIEALFLKKYSITSSDGFGFHFNIDESLPDTWVSQFRGIMDNLNTTVPVTKRERTTLYDGKNEMNVYTWRQNGTFPFESAIGDGNGACICGTDRARYMILEISNDEFVYDYIHRYSVIAHEYFHVYQMNASEVEPPYIKYMMEGGAAVFEALYIQQYYGMNYFLNDQNDVTDLAVDSPVLFETFNDTGVENNYSNSAFIVLALVKELQNGGDTEIEAFRKVYIDWWGNGAQNLTKEVHFEAVFGFSIATFYTALGSYSADMSTVIPSADLTIQNIFID